MQDLKFACRQLLKNPGFSVVAVLTLALGIGATTTVFSLIRGVLWRPLPFPDSDRFVQIDMVHPERGLTAKGTSYLNFQDWRGQNEVFREMAAVEDTLLTLSAEGEAEQIHGWRVSDSFFALLGVPPLRGRFLAPQAETGEGEAVVSYGLWQRRFGARSDILGQSVTIDGKPFSIVGVMPAGFHLPGDTSEVWIPLSHGVRRSSRGEQLLLTLACLKEGADLGRAQAGMDIVARRLAQQYPTENAGWGVRLNPLRGVVTGSLRPVLWILFGCVGLVFLIVCLNLANLVLARGTARSREIAIRLALGASRFRVIRQFMVENLVLAVAGGGAGWLLALWGLRLLERIPASSDVPVLVGGLQTVPAGAARADAAVLLFLLFASVAAGLLFGLIPAWQASRSNPQEALKESGPGSVGPAGRRPRLRHGLMVAQVAIALVLLVGAALLIKSLGRLTRVDLGFRCEQVLCADLSLPLARYPGETQVSAFWEEVRVRASGLAGVQQVAAVNTPPFGMNFMAGFAIEGRPAREPGQAEAAMYRVATPDYFSALGIPLLRGRPLGREDGREAPGVVVVDDTMAKRYWPGADPVGAKLRVNGGAPRTVVGVVGAVRHAGPDEAAAPTIYLPQAQEPPGSRQMTLLLRCATAPTAAAPALRAVVKGIDPQLPVAQIRTLDSVASASVLNRRLMAWGLAGFGTLALVLVAMGLYGVVALTVARRTREIGIRMALGALRSQVVLLVVRQGMALTLLGVGFGWVGALAATRLLGSVLYEVKTTDALAFVGGATLLLLVALLACWLPARRAAMVDPVKSLRQP